MKATGGIEQNRAGDAVGCPLFVAKYGGPRGIMVVMEIDLLQLPIPDWDVRCPQCDYPLRGLPSHRCPECGLKLDVPSIIRPWHRLRDPRFSGAELPLPDFGLTCGGCGEPLAGATRRECPSCAHPFDLEALRPTGHWFDLDDRVCGSLPIRSVTTILENDYVPVITQEQARHGLQTFDERNLVASEFYFDVLWLLRREGDRLARLHEPDGDNHWSCPSCNEENPESFEVCWNCDAVPPD